MKALTWGHAPRTDPPHAGAREPSCVQIIIEASLQEEGTHSHDGLKRIGSLYLLALQPWHRPPTSDAIML